MFGEIYSGRKNWETEVCDTVCIGKRRLHRCALFT